MRHQGYQITGGSPLSGHLRVPGAKNAALPEIAASLLVSKGEVVLRNLPYVQDVKTLINLISYYGVTVDLGLSDQARFDATHLTLNPSPNQSANQIRASILVLGPLLARGQKVRLAWPGGCSIGQRPVDLHLEGLRALGADIACGVDYIVASAPQRLTGNTIQFPKVTVGGTENIMMAATLAQGQTVIENAAREPEIIDLANFLNACGAKIVGAGTSTITITGVKALHGATHTVMPDRIITATYMTAAAVTRGEIQLSHAAPKTLSAVVDLFDEAGLIVECGHADMQVQSDPTQIYQAMSFTTGVYPEMPTDVQALMTVFNCFGRGEFAIEETIFENRYAHVEQLNKCGAGLTLKENCIVGEGGRALHPGQVLEATDLRAGAALVLMALGIRGTTTVSHIRHIERGYPDFVSALRQLSASMNVVDLSSPPTDGAQTFYNFFYHGTQGMRREPTVGEPMPRLPR